jgi:tetratricopeptide (TPR) repeat protein
VLPFLWVQKYSDILNLTTLAQKETYSWPQRGRWRLLIQLPLWLLAPACGPINFSSNSPGKAAASLEQADLLFANGQYSAAAPRYHTQIWRQQQVSPQLLLRMAYAQHQLGHYAAEMLYLNLAQVRQPRLGTWRQLAALAQRQRLVGYPTTWQQEVRVQAQRYYYPGLQSLLTVAVLLAIGLLVRRQRVKPGAWLAYVAYLVVVGAYLELLRPAPVGVVTRAGAALMAGPGAGATWLSTAAPGDRLVVLGQDDIWLRVRWQQRVAYVRASDALVVE